MSRRNLTLLIIILILAVVAVFGFLYFRQSTNTTDTADGDSWGTNFISQFNPFGASKPTPPATTPPANVSGYVPPIGEAVNVKLKKISSMPVAGFGLFQKERLKEIIPIPTKPLTEFAPAIRYVERAGGIIYQTFADKIEEQKFSLTIIPKVYEAHFGNKGGSVIMRYLKADDRTVETFVGTLPKEPSVIDTMENPPTAEKIYEIKGSFLPENIKDISLSPDSQKIFYLFNVGDNIVGTIFNLLDKKKTQIFDSPFTEWLSLWPNAKMITLTTRPSANVSGYMYAIDLNNKNRNTKILGGINGLTTLTSPNGKLILYSNNNLSLYVYHTDTRDSDVIGVKTLAEKCVWGKISDVIYCAVPKVINTGYYPDTWYQGETSFSDEIWKIDIKNGNTTIIADPGVLIAEDIDGIKLALDEGENYLFFVNKKDSFLWELGLK